MIFHFFQIISIFLLISFFTLYYIGFGIFFKNRIFGKKTELNLGELGLILFNKYFLFKNFFMHIIHFTIFLFF